MSIETLIEAFAMGKHGVYVWSAYGLFFLVIIGWWLYLNTQIKRLIRVRILQRDRQLRYEKKRHEKKSKKNNLDEENK